MSRVITNIVTLWFLTHDLAPHKSGPLWYVVTLVSLVLRCAVGPVGVWYYNDERLQMYQITVSVL